MNRLVKTSSVRLRLLALLVALVVLFLIVACGSTPGPLGMSESLPSAAVTSAPAPTSRPAAMSAAAQPTAAPAQPRAVPALLTTPVPPPPGSSNSGDLSTIQDFDRKIIKNANLTIVVASADTAIFRFTGIVKDVGGYIVSNRVYSDNNTRGATMVVAVPVDRFEETLNLVRQVPQEIVQDFIASSDVTDEFIDLEARLKNLEATSARIRALLDKATTVEEALKINVELGNIEGQIEQIKGRLNGLTQRTSYSTITLDMREPQPSPTPTPTATPIGWRPDETINRAVNAQTNLLRNLGDSAIYLGIVLLPYVIVLALIGLLIRWFVQRNRRPSVPRA